MQNCQVIDIVHHDMSKGNQATGPHGISAEQVFRTAVLRQLKRYSWRELSKRINDGICLRMMYLTWGSDVFSSRLEAMNTRSSWIII